MDEKIEGIRPVIDRMRACSGAPGLVVGIIKDYNDYKYYFGCRDVEKEYRINENTMFHIGSLTKSMTAAALGILVDQEKLKWSTPVYEILPEMSKDTEIYRAKLTVVDILSHRTGKAWYDALYLQSNNRILLNKDQSIQTSDSLPQVASVREKYMYNNHAYNIAGLVIEKVSGMSWTEFVTKNIFEPLKMNRTMTHHPEGDDNVAVPYNILSNREPWKLPPCNVSGETSMFAGQSVWSSITDLLEYSMALLRALREVSPTPLRWIHSRGRHWRSAETPIRQITTLVQTHIARPAEHTIWEQGSALGWNRTQIPGELDFGCNRDLVEDMPVFGRDNSRFEYIDCGYSPKTAIWHGGNTPGATAAVCLLPDVGTAVVVLQNSLGLCDVAEWTCRMVLDTMFLEGEDKDQRPDYVLLAETASENNLKRMKKATEQLDSKKISGTQPRPLSEYCGTYHRKVGDWFIKIGLDEETAASPSLYLEFLGRDDERYALRHQHYNTFRWDLPYDELVKRGQYIRPCEFYVFGFETDALSGAVNALKWVHDPAVPEGEVFRKSS